MKRLLDGSLPPRAATLLRSAATDVPLRAAEEKARLASVVASEVTAPAAGGRVSSGKWMGILSLATVVAAGAIGTGYQLSTAGSTPRPPSSSEAPPLDPPPASPAQGTELATPAPAPPKSVDVMDLPSAPALRSQPARALAAPSAEHLADTAARPSSGAPSLSDELAAVDAARAAFVERNPGLAVDRVESYRRRFPSGHFMDEAEALEIQALVALGRNDEARTKANRFLATRPESPYAQRVRSAIGAKK